MPNLNFAGVLMILILFIDCRPLVFVIPAKLVLSKVEGAEIQTLPVGLICSSFDKF